VAGRGAGTDDGAPASELALSETNDEGGCSVRSGRTNGGAWVLFVALALGTQSRRRRSRAS
jgi:MYXO-CTERM domain-containing protein